MALWSCPHCGAVQAASSRCWVCRRSSTTCSTCRNFRAALAADVGWCALDRRRRPLTGLELRGCWSERAAGAAASEHTPRPTPTPDPAWDLPQRGFIPVGDVAQRAAPTAPSIDLPLGTVEMPDGWDARVSLFGDLER